MTSPGRDDLSGHPHRQLSVAESVAFGLLVVEAFVILGCVAAAIANQAQYGGQDFSVEGSHAWGYTLTLAATWSNPAAVVVFLLAPLGLVAWSGRREAGRLSDDRSRFVLRLGLLLAVLTIVGGIFTIVGRVLQSSPSQAWSNFFLTLGIGVGSVVLGLLAVAVVRWLADDMRVDLFARQHAEGPDSGNDTP